MITLRWCSEVITHRSADYQSKRRPSARRMGGVNAVFGALLASRLVGRRLARLRRSLAEQVLQIGAHLLGVKTGGRRRRGLVRCVHPLTLSPAPAGCRINPANVSVKQGLRRVSQARTWGKKAGPDSWRTSPTLPPSLSKALQTWRRATWLRRTICHPSDNRDAMQKAPAPWVPGLELGRVRTFQAPCGACPPRLFHQITEH